MHVPPPSAEKDRARTASRRRASPCRASAGAFGWDRFGLSSRLTAAGQLTEVKGGRLVRFADTPRRPGLPQPDFRFRGAPVRSFACRRTATRSNSGRPGSARGGTSSWRAGAGGRAILPREPHVRAHPARVGALRPPCGRRHARQREAAPGGAGHADFGGRAGRRPRRLLHGLQLRAVRLSGAVSLCARRRRKASASRHFSLRH